LGNKGINQSTKMNHITSLVRATVRTPVVLGLTFTAAILLISASTGSAGEAAAAPTAKNVVLVHGAFADGSSWAKVIPLLEAKGLRVTAVQNPLSSLADDVAATKRAIANQDGPVILVGHSWAGMVISEAGNDPKVAGLVYVAALVPDEGQSASDVVKPYPPGPGLGEAKPDAAGFLSLTRKGIDEDFVPDVPAAERAIVYATQGRWNSACLSDKVSAPAWTTKPSWYIAVNDRMLSPEYEQVIAKHIHATTTTLPTGHVPMLSKPKEVAAVIIEAANTPFTALDAAHASAQSVFPADFRTQEIQAHSAFAQFLSIPKDAEDNKVSMTTRLTMPVLAIGAEKAFGANVAIVMRNAADNVTEVLIANSGHWLMDEQPAATIAAVRNFLDRKTTTQSLKLGKRVATNSDHND
jgi:pimeloyl-ACP methyl ester carboxylesterase